MKSNGFNNSLTGSIIMILLCFIPFLGNSQADYSFTNGSLVSGTNLQAGAVYRFQNVKPLIDALVTIKGFTNGASLDILDETGTGFNEAFQPRVKLASNSKNCYAEFEIKFVLAGTIIPAPQALVYVTAIDIDGHQLPGDTLQEFDNINLGVTSIIDFEALAGGLAISNNSLWYIGKNVNGVEYDGIDTAAKNVMYTVSGALVTTITVRSGGDNKVAGVSSRQRSIYFKRFTYPGSILLPLPKLMSFEGNCSDAKVKLNWKFETTEGLQQCILERTNNNLNDYQPIAHFLLTKEQSVSSYNYTDQLRDNVNACYRLKLIGNNGEIRYSNVLSFRNKTAIKTQLEVYPSIVKSSITVNVHSTENQNSILMVSDMSGRLLKQQNISLQRGDNSISAAGFDQLRKGNYVVSLTTAEGILSKQVIVH